MTLLEWLRMLTDHFILMAANIRLMEARLKKLEEEVRALKQQHPQP
ncbi:MAG: hypothetical protein U0Z53_28970 [Blastocatellia bacterium]